MNLCICFYNGKYSYFAGVKDLLIQDNVLTFKHFDRDSKKEKDEKFDLTRIPGYSIIKEGLTY